MGDFFEIFSLKGFFDSLVGRNQLPVISPKLYKRMIPMHQFIWTVIVFVSFFVGLFFLNRRLKNDSYFKRHLTESLLVWSIFSIFFALLPIIFKALVTNLMGKQPYFPDLVSDGELLIVSAGIAADGAGRILSSIIPETLYKVSAGGSCIVLLSLSSLLFATIAMPNASLQVDVIFSVSITIFTLTMISSAVCVVLESGA